MPKFRITKPDNSTIDVIAADVNLVRNHVVFMNTDGTPGVLIHADEVRYLVPVLPEEAELIGD